MSAVFQILLMCVPIAAILFYGVHLRNSGQEYADNVVQSISIGLLDFCIWATEGLINLVVLLLGVIVVIASVILPPAICYGIAAILTGIFAPGEAGARLIVTVVLYAALLIVNSRNR